MGDGGRTSATVPARAAPGGCALIGGPLASDLGSGTQEPPPEAPVVPVPAGPVVPERDDDEGLDDRELDDEGLDDPEPDVPEPDVPDDDVPDPEREDPDVPELELFPPERVPDPGPDPEVGPAPPVAPPPLCSPEWEPEPCGAEALDPEGDDARAPGAE